MLPSVMHELYKKNNEIHTYGTRNKNLFRIDKGQKGLNIYLNSYSNVYRMHYFQKLILMFPYLSLSLC